MRLVVEVPVFLLLSWLVVGSDTRCWLGEDKAVLTGRRTVDKVLEVLLLDDGLGSAGGVVLAAAGVAAGSLVCGFGRLCSWVELLGDRCGGSGECARGVGHEGTSDLGLVDDRAVFG